MIGDVSTIQNAIKQNIGLKNEPFNRYKNLNSKINLMLASQIDLSAPVFYSTSADITYTANTTITDFAIRGKDITVNTGVTLTINSASNDFAICCKNLYNNGLITASGRGGAGGISSGGAGGDGYYGGGGGGSGGSIYTGQTTYKGGNAHYATGGAGGINVSTTDGSPGASYTGFAGLIPHQLGGAGGGTTTYTSGVGGAYAAILNDFMVDAKDLGSGVGEGAFTMVVYSKKLGEANPVEGWIVRNAIGHQNRRKVGIGS